MFCMRVGNGDWHLKLVPTGETKRVARMIDRPSHLESFLAILFVTHLAYKGSREPDPHTDQAQSLQRLEQRESITGTQTCAKGSIHHAVGLCEPTALRARVRPSSLLPKRIGSENTNLRARGGLAQPPLEQLSNARTPRRHQTI